MLRVYHTAYRYGLRPLLFRMASAQTAHNLLLRGLAWADRYPQWLPKHLPPCEPLCVGGVQLDSPLILAAGLVKGRGFASEEEALAAVHRGENIIPGWRSLSTLLGAIEVGSFTRHPRLGNPGTVLWRDPATHSTQNHVGLKNPGARAAALFLSQHRPPKLFGINLAVSPGVTDWEQEAQELGETWAFFQGKGQPSWVTLNLSCPNTEDDPQGHQTEAKARQLCRLMVGQVAPLPLWVKVSPGLAPDQYHKLMGVFAAEGVQAVIATNTLAQPSPPDPKLTAGVGGGRLHAHALAAVKALRANPVPVDVIGCGGVLDHTSYQAFRALGATAVQYWSALVYQGPLAPAIILETSLCP